MGTSWEVMGNDTRYQVYAYAHKKKTDILNPKMEIWMNSSFSTGVKFQVLAVDFQVIIDWSGLIVKLSKAAENHRCKPR